MEIYSGSCPREICPEIGSQVYTFTDLKIKESRLAIAEKIEDKGHYKPPLVKQGLRMDSVSNYSCP